MMLVVRSKPEKLFRKFSHFFNWSLNFLHKVESFTLLSVWFCRRFNQSTRHRLILSYNSNAICDGTGSQVQRLISTYFLSKVLGLSYKHTKIVDLTVTQLDSFQNANEIKDYLDELNNVFFLDSFGNSCDLSECSARVKIRHLDFFQIFRALIHLKLNKASHICFEVTFPYKIVDCLEFNTDGMHNIINSLQSYKHSRLRNETAVIHLRSGWGRDVVAPGEKITRQMSLDFYRESVKTLLHKANKQKRSIDEILIFTDAPENTFSYSPPAFQLIRWDRKNLNGNSTEINGVSDETLRSISNLPITIIRGGNPLDVLGTMAHCDFLILSKSSLGYVGALLNKQGTVIFPPGFWHRKQATWLIGK